MGRFESTGAIEISTGELADLRARVIRRLRRGRAEVRGGDLSLLLLPVRLEMATPGRPAALRAGDFAREPAPMARAA